MFVQYIKKDKILQSCFWDNMNYYLLEWEYRKTGISIVLPLFNLSMNNIWVALIIWPISIASSVVNCKMGLACKKRMPKIGSNFFKGVNISLKGVSSKLSGKHFIRVPLDAFWFFNQPKIQRGDPYKMSNIKFVQSCWNFPQLSKI